MELSHTITLEVVEGVSDFPNRVSAVGTKVADFVKEWVVLFVRVGVRVSLCNNSALFSTCSGPSNRFEFVALIVEVSERKISWDDVSESLVDPGGELVSDMVFVSLRLEDLLDVAELEIEGSLLKEWVLEGESVPVLVVVLVGFLLEELVCERSRVSDTLELRETLADAVGSLSGNSDPELLDERVIVLVSDKLEDTLGNELGFCEGDCDEDMEKLKLIDSVIDSLTLLELDKFVLWEYVLDTLAVSVRDWEAELLWKWESEIVFELVAEWLSVFVSELVLLLDIELLWDTGSHSEKREQLWERDSLIDKLKLVVALGVVIVFDALIDLEASNKSDSDIERELDWDSIKLTVLELENEIDRVSDTELLSDMLVVGIGESLPVGDTVSEIVVVSEILCVADSELLWLIPIVCEPLLESVIEGLSEIVVLGELLRVSDIEPECDNVLVSDTELERLIIAELLCIMDSDVLQDGEILADLLIVPDSETDLEYEIEIDGVGEPSGRTEGVSEIELLIDMDCV